MELKKIDAKTARSNVSFAMKSIELKKEEERKIKIQTVFNLIADASKEGKYQVGVNINTFGLENYNDIISMLDELGYKYNYISGNGVYKDYLLITWL